MPGKLSDEELADFRMYAETGGRLGDVVATDEWILESFRRLVAVNAELSTDLADTREAYAEWRTDHDRLIIVEMDLRKRAKSGKPLPCAELKEIIAKPRKKKAS